MAEQDMDRMPNGKQGKVGPRAGGWKGSQEEVTGRGLPYGNP